MVREHAAGAVRGAQVAAAAAEVQAGVGVEDQVAVPPASEPVPDAVFPLTDE